MAKRQISPDGFTMGAHTLRNLVATGVFTNNSTQDMSGEVSWRSSDDTVVSVSADNGLAQAVMLTPGRAEITASYSGAHGSKDAKITVVVDPPTIAIVPENPAVQVGVTLRFLAFAVDKANDGPALLDASVIAWSSDEPTRVSIDAHGNATVRALRPAAED